MNIPLMLFGNFIKVKKEIKKNLPLINNEIELKRSIEELNLAMINSGEFEVVLNKSSLVNRADNIFNMFTLPEILIECNEVSERNSNLYFEYFRQSFWGHICLSCRQYVYHFYGSENNRIKYVQDLLKYRLSYQENEQNFMVNKSLLVGMHRKSGSIIDHPDHVATFVLGNMEYVKNNIGSYTIKEALQKFSVFELIEYLKVDRYIENVIFD